MKFVYYAVFIPLSHLPLWALYRLSDVAFFAMYYVVGYRKRVVVENLRSSFPEKSPAEIESLARKFFAHLCDLIVESIKGSSISEAEIARRHRYTNPGLLAEYHAKGKSLSILGAHYGNWEWVALSLPLVTRYKTHGIFQTLNNEFMNRTIKASRERNGMKLISTKEVSRTLRDSTGELITMGYIADQSPARTSRHHWIKFLGQDTPANFGYERFAREYDTPVLYLNVTKVGRGYYECTFHPVTDEPAKLAEGALAEQFMRQLEGVIRKQPEYWLWSHRRWKIKKPT
ncbi:MAG: lysophospholipid acyltransferase family protein [Deltaproteobacteria bacterium]|nr:lysophospholipid acyltransferase family protein [Deltaproteobacteria bacterium]